MPWINLQGVIMENGEEKEVVVPDVPFQDKLALKEYTNKAIASLKDEQLGSLKGDIFGAVKKLFGFGNKDK